MANLVISIFFVISFTSIALVIDMTLDVDKVIYATFYLVICQESWTRSNLKKSTKEGK